MRHGEDVRRKFILGQDSCRVPVVRHRAPRQMCEVGTSEEREGKTSIVGNVLQRLENENLEAGDYLSWTIRDRQLYLQLNIVLRSPLEKN